MPGMLQSMGLQRVEHNLAAEQRQQWNCIIDPIYQINVFFFCLPSYFFLHSWDCFLFFMMGLLWNLEYLVIYEL